MGIFGALTTAVTGLRAQAYALENVSGNIANSQTTAFKRIDSSFEDMIPDNSVSQQIAGSVAARSRTTNTVQGDIQSASVGTFMAINGDGFFVVSKPDSFTNGNPNFTGNELYTRRGDFQPDKNGYLVNGAGYYLMGVPVDPLTGTATSSTPQMLQFQNSYLPAQPTTQIDYHANLASTTTALDTSKFSANPVYGASTVAKLTGTGATLAADAPAKLKGTVDLTTFSSAGGTLVIGSTNITIGAGANLAAVQAAINAQTGTTGVTAGDDGNGHLTLTGPDAKTQLTIGAGTTPGLLTEFGISSGSTNPTNLLTQGVVLNGQTLTLSVNGGPTQTITFGSGNVETLNDLSTALGGLSGVSTSVDSTGNISITATNPAHTLTVGGTASAANFGLSVTSAYPATGNVAGADKTAFQANSVEGGIIAARDAAGTSVNVHLRWAKVGANTWNLYYENDSAATGSNPAWTNAGVNFTFGANGQMSPAVSSTVINNMTINGVSLGDITVAFGQTGLTQFNSDSKVNLQQENSVAAGELQSVGVNDKGNIVGTYSNGRTLVLANITLANFKGAEQLKRIDGGAFVATDGSGVATYDAPGSILAQSLEGSNTDIADEFTKLIITQQAYSANTKVVTTSNEMVQDLLNMLR
ncbi:MAG: flagellar hook-basal body complex protein [Pseudolabrys sp.]|nr:flagellar hook-basal body complex protein [Pseudolabrys sp.]MCW5682890.1 flagellar hook-basal body complex protein [Pseudolabrys sp.]